MLFRHCCWCGSRLTDSTVNAGGAIERMDLGIIVAMTTWAYAKTIVLVLRLRAAYLNQTVANVRHLRPSVCRAPADRQNFIQT